MRLNAYVRRAGSFAATAVFATLATQPCAYAQQKRPLACTPAVLTDSSTLILQFRLPHPAELAVQAPDGTPFFLVYERNETTPAGQKPLVEKAAFRSMAELKLNVSTAVGSPLVYGRDSNERIFSQPGVYKVILADVYQSDRDQNVYRCRVTLKRPR
jgi:hypothetical protein